MSEEELRAITEHFKYCIKNNVIRDEEYVLMGMEKILNLIEKQQEERENSVSKDKIRALEKEYSIKCAVLSRSATPDQWYSMGRNIGRTLAYQELLEVE